MRLTAFGISLVVSVMFAVMTAPLAAETQQAGEVQGRPGVPPPAGNSPAGARVQALLLCAMRESGRQGSRRRPS